MIQFLSVSKNFDDQIFSLQDISFEIQEGEFVFLVGPSGSGKTSIIKLLIREENPSAGKIFFEDEDITGFNRNKVYQLRRRIGVIFQDFKLINELSAYENIAFAMEAAGKPDSEIKENVPYLLDIVGLSHRANSFPYQLSGGEKQRVAIARAMSNNPRLLIADEPTGNLDPETAWDIAQILYKINNWGTTVIMSTHGSDIVNSMHKRVIRLQNGNIVRDDFKGSYDDIDEFSLKIINATNNSETKEKIILPKEIETPNEEIKIITKETEEKPRTGKKISFSTKKRKVTEPIVLVEDAETVKVEPVEEIEVISDDNVLNDETTDTEEIVTTEALEIIDLEMSKPLKKKLMKLGYETLDQVVERGVDDLKETDNLNTKELKELSKVIKNYLSSENI